MNNQKEKSTYSEISTRIFVLFDYFKSEKGINNSDLLEKADINHSFITNLKRGGSTNPNSEMIRRIVIATGCNGHWLLTGEGQMFEERQSTGEDSTVAFIYKAHQVMDVLESKRDELIASQLPADLELGLARLLVRVLEGRRVASRRSENH
jgi:hypothetical protein